MLSALILICSIAATPALESCNRGNAVDVISVPQTFSSPVACMMAGQAYLAGSALGRDMAADERVKVVCTPAAPSAEHAESLLAHFGSR
jgi:hypothetical protein